MGVPGPSGLSLRVLTGGLLAIDCALGAFTPYQRAPREPCRGRLVEGAVPDPTCPLGVSLWVRVHLHVAFLPSHSGGWVGKLPLKGQEQPSLQYGAAGGADCLRRVLVLRGRRRLGLSTPPSSCRAQADHSCSTPLRRWVLPWGERLGVSGRHRAGWTHSPQSPPPPLLTWGSHLSPLLWAERRPLLPSCWLPGKYQRRGCGESGSRCPSGLAPHFLLKVPGIGLGFH